LQDSLGLWGQNTTGEDAENCLNDVFSSKYRTRLEHQFWTGHGVLHPRALYSDLIFELTLAPSLQADKHSAGVRNYPQRRAGQGSEETNVYSSAKAFPYDHIMRKEATFAKTHGQQAGHQSKPTAPVTQGHTCFSTNPTQRHPRHRKIRLSRHHQMERHGERSSHKRIYDNRILGHDMWQEISRFQ